MLEIKIIVTEIKKAFDRLISKPDMAEEKAMSLRFSQKKSLKLKITEKKK